MPVETIERAPELSCYLCGSTDIYSVCHHCAKPMCEKHSPFAFRVAGKLARDQGPSAKLASQEYGGLKLETPQAAVYHCEEHDHAVSGLGRLLAIGSAIAVLGLIVALFAALPGILILLAGAAVAGYDIYKMNQGRAAMATATPALPLFPHVRTARVVEELQGRVDLTESGYLSTAGDVTGTLVLSMTHSDWQERLRQYRRKHRITDDAPVNFNAGFAILQGPVGLNFTEAQPLILEAGTGLWFREGYPATTSSPRRRGAMRATGAPRSPTSCRMAGSRRRSRCGSSRRWCRGRTSGRCRSTCTGPR